MNKPEFEDVYETNYSKIFNYILHRVRSYELTCDLVSEAFLKAYLSYSKFSNPEMVLPWLYRIAGNEVNQHYRRKSTRLMDQLSRDYAGQLPDPSNFLTEKIQAEEAIIKNEQFVQVSRAMTDLSTKYQEVLSLKYFEQLTIEEICQVLNKKEGTIKSLLSRGMKKLRTLLQPE